MARLGFFPTVVDGTALEDRGEEACGVESRGERSHGVPGDAERAVGKRQDGLVEEE